MPDLAGHDLTLPRLGRRAGGGGGAEVPTPALVSNPGLTLAVTAAGSGWNITVSGDTDYNGSYFVASAALQPGLPVRLLPPSVTEAGGVLTAQPGLWISPASDPAGLITDWLEGGVAQGDTDASYTPAFAHTQIERRETATNAAGSVTQDVVARADNVEPEWAALRDDAATRAVWDAAEMSSLARFGGGAVTADGQEVGAWSDRIGTVMATETGNVSRAPAYHSDGTRHWLQPDGVDDRLGFATRFGLPANPAITVSALVNVSSIEPENWLFWLGTSTTGTLGFAIGKDRIGFRYGGGYRLFPAPPHESWSVVQWVRPAGGNYASGRVFVNGIEMAATSTANGGAAPSDAGNGGKIFYNNSNFVRTRTAALVVQESDTAAARTLSHDWLSYRRGT